jgi:hypothetical protein
MSTPIRTTLTLVIGLVLLSTLTIAQSGANNTDKDKSKEHHSRLAKAAFWRHHKDANKNVQQGQAKQVPSKAPQAKTAQLKPVSAKQVTGKKDQQHDSNISKSSATKAVTNKTKPQQKAQPKPVSLKQ